MHRFSEILLTLNNLLTFVARTELFYCNYYYIQILKLFGLIAGAAFFCEVARSRTLVVIFLLDRREPQNLIDHYVIQITIRTSLKF